MEGSASPISPTSNASKSKKNNMSSKINNKQAMKVVYISNPVRVKASSASEFRALVQELTGKDSYWADNEPAHDHHHLQGRKGIDDDRHRSEGVGGAATDDNDQQLIWSTNSLLEDMLVQPLNIRS